MALHYVSHKFEKLFTNESVVGLFPVQADNKTHLFLTKTYSWIWGTWHTFWRGGVSACLIGMKSHTESTCRIFTHFDYASSSVPTSDISFFLSWSATIRNISLNVRISFEVVLSITCCTSLEVSFQLCKKSWTCK